MDTHPNIAHWDDVEAVERTSGELGAARRRVGPVVGLKELGLSRWQVHPGLMPAPPHVHADEEEVFFVLGGAGLVWQDGRTFPIAPGDTIVFPANAGAHTVIAGDDGLDVLAFGEGSRTGITYLPRSKTFWLGPRWSPPDGPNPFKAEAQLEPLERPEPGPERPANVVPLADAPAQTYDVAGYEGTERTPAEAGGCDRVGLRHTTLQPGALSCPPHVHGAAEEVFVVLEGSGLAWLGDERHPLRPGSILARPAGTGVAHALEAGPDGLTFLGFGHRRSHETVWYPRSKKLLIGDVMLRVEPVDYFDGELPAKP